jgi:hypothetical protein
MYIINMPISTKQKLAIAATIAYFALGMAPRVLEQMGRGKGKVKGKRRGGWVVNKPRNK